MKDIIDPFHRALRSVVLEKIEQRVDELVTASAKDYSDYCGQVSYIKAFKDILSIAYDLEMQIYGGKLNKGLEETQDLY